MSTTETRTLHAIALEVYKDWGEKIYYGAEPYLHAMRQLGSIDEKYGYDDGRDIVLYFLSNARTWKGETARRIKAELKGML